MDPAFLIKTKPYQLNVLIYRWFTHFYVVGVLVNSIAVYIIASAYLYGQQPPVWYIDILEFFKSTPETHTGRVMLDYVTVIERNITFILNLRNRITVNFMVIQVHCKHFRFINVTQKPWIW